MRLNGVKKSVGAECNSAELIPFDQRRRSKRSQEHSGFAVLVNIRRGPELVIRAVQVPRSKCDACIHIREVPHHSEPEQSEANQSANVCDLSEWLHKRANSMTEFCEAQENFSVIKI